jgi:hypothetical protein
MILTKKYVIFMITRLSFTAMFITLIWASGVHAAATNQYSVGLHVTPERCVALRQGQTCYQEVTFNWRQSQKGNYCLVELSTKHVLQCWQQVNSGMFAWDFQSNESREFALRGQDQTENLAATHITVSWVFKSSKRPKSSWKLF